MNEDQLISCLSDLCQRFAQDALEGRYEVARQAGLSEQYLYQILTGKPMANGNKRSVGKIARTKLTKAFPDWLNTPMGEAASQKNVAFTSGNEQLGGVVFRQINIHAACGNGYENQDYPALVSSIALSEQEAREQVGSLNKNGTIQVVSAFGDSMVPTIKPRDLLFVDTSINEYQGEGIYLLRNEHELLCKRLSMAGRTLTVSSDSGSPPSWKWKDRHETAAIIGRVVAALPMEFKRF